jgi:hypothetical protein
MLRATPRCVYTDLMDYMTDPVLFMDIYTEFLMDHNASKINSDHANIAIEEMASGYEISA